MAQGRHSLDQRSSSVGSIPGAPGSSHQLDLRENSHTAPHYRASPGTPLQQTRTYRLARSGRLRNQGFQAARTRRHPGGRGINSTPGASATAWPERIQGLQVIRKLSSVPHNKISAAPVQWDHPCPSTLSHTLFILLPVAFPSPRILPSPSLSTPPNPCQASWK